MTFLRDFLKAFTLTMLCILAAVLLLIGGVAMADGRPLSQEERIEDCATSAVATALHKARARGQSATPETGGRCFKTADPHPKVVERCLRLARHRCSSGRRGDALVSQRASG